MNKEPDSVFWENLMESGGKIDLGNNTVLLFSKDFSHNEQALCHPLTNRYKDLFFGL